MKDTKAVSFVNIDERRVVKLAKSEYVKQGEQPLHNSMIFTQKIQEYVNDQFYNGLTIVSLENSTSGKNGYRFKEIKIKCNP